MVQATRKCSIDDCTNHGKITRGLCNKHYHRLRAYGDPTYKPPRKSDKLCKVDGCTTPGRTSGWCQKHYMRWLQNGDPSKAAHDRYSTAELSFANRVEEVSGHLIWTGTKTNAGYGQISVDGSRKTAHRYAWERVNGPIPEGMVVDHICHTPSCVKLEHLRLVDLSGNAQHRQGLGTNNKSGYRGVYWDNNRKKYVAKVTHLGTQYHVGAFPSAKSAGIAAALKRQELGFLLSEYDQSLIEQDR